MKVKIFKAINPKAVEVLKNLINNETLPVLAGYKLFGILKHIEALQLQADQFRLHLIGKFASKDENGNIQADGDRAKFASQEDEQLFATEYAKFLNEEEVDLDQLTIEELGSSIQMKPTDLFHLIGLAIQDKFQEQPKLPSLTKLITEAPP